MKKIKIYIAGAFHDKQNIQNYQKIILSSIPNSVITHDWTKVEVDSVYERTDEENDINAALDLYKGVFNADLLIAIQTIDDYAYRGTEREIGFAQGRNIPVYRLTSGNKKSYVASNVFHYLTKGQKNYTDFNILLEDIKKYIVA
jgi:nucleoside 2-deoxyribosyltransferase